MQRDSSSVFAEAVDHAVTVICEGASEEFSFEVSDAVETLRDLIERSADLTRKFRMSLREAARKRWFEDDVLGIIRRSRTPADQRARDTAESEAAIRASAEREWQRELADRAFDRDTSHPSFWRELSEKGRIRAVGVDRRLTRARLKKPREVARSQERRLARLAHIMCDAV